MRSRPKLVPLKVQTELEDPELFYLMDEACFKDESGAWVLFWKDGHYINIKTGPPRCLCCK